MAECKCPFRVPASRSRLRVISTNAKFTVEPEPVRCVYEFEDAYQPNQAIPLFRNVLRVKERAQVAIHVGVPPGNGNVYIKLQVFDKGEEIYSTEGKRCCIIPVLYLYPTQKKEEEFHKYIVQASITKYIPSETDDTPRARVKTRLKKKKAGKTAVAGAQGGGASVAWQEDENVWQLRIMSSVAVDVKKDTEREDRQASIKASWETPNPGRAAKARTSRDKFLHGLTLIPSSLDPEAKDGSSNSKYVKISTLPISKVRIKCEGVEDEMVDVEQVVTRPCYDNLPNTKNNNNPLPKSQSLSSSLQSNTDPSPLPSSSSPPLSLPSTSLPQSTHSPRTLTKPPSSLSLLLPPPPPTLSPLSHTALTHSLASSYASSACATSRDAQNEKSRCARVRTKSDSDESLRIAASAKENFLIWRDASVAQGRAELRMVEQTREEVLAYLEASRAEVKKINMTFAERMEQYNLKMFPQIVQPIQEKEVQVSQAKEKGKRKKVAK